MEAHLSGRVRRQVGFSYHAAASSDGWDEISKRGTSIREGARVSQTTKRSADVWPTEWSLTISNRQRKPITRPRDKDADPSTRGEGDCTRPTPYRTVPIMARQQRTRRTSDGGWYAWGGVVAGMIPIRERLPSEEQDLAQSGVRLRTTSTQGIVAVSRTPGMVAMATHPSHLHPSPVVHNSGRITPRCNRPPIPPTQDGPTRYNGGAVKPAGPA